MHDYTSINVCTIMISLREVLPGSKPGNFVACFLGHGLGCITGSEEIN